MATKKRKISASRETGVEYKINPIHSKKPFLGWINKETGEHINLLATDENPEFATRTKATLKRPAKEIVYKAPTQDDLRTYYNLGHQNVVLKIETEDDNIDESE